MAASDQPPNVLTLPPPERGLMIAIGHNAAADEFV
jgi:hypothetical protein